MRARVLARDHPCGGIEAKRLAVRLTGSHTNHRGAGTLSFPDLAWMGIENHDPLPDLTDPATLGCLLALVREAWAPWRPGLWLYVTVSSTPEGEFRFAVSGRGRNSANVSMSDWYASEAEALVSALESAPTQEKS